MMQKLKIGIIGTGNISPIYIKNTKTFQVLDLTACSDIINEKAVNVARIHGVPRACTVQELLDDPEIKIVLNLTPPAEHSKVAMQVLTANKSLYGEKPMAITREAAMQMRTVAEASGLRIGNSPDTFLGAGFQTCRKLIDEGVIGTPLGATAFMLSHGPEDWHPDPEFVYEMGGGPMLDMGPYYLTWLVGLLGPVERVAGLTKISFPERIIGSLPKKGKVMKVEVPTHVTGLLDFKCGAAGLLLTSFDVWGHELPRIEIYGSEGTLSVPDPNHYGGPVRLMSAHANHWTEIPLLPGYTENSRGLGVADMATAMLSGRAHRANEKMAYHVLDIMLSIYDSSASGQYLHLESTCERPAPLPAGLPAGELDN
jgi:predicted dehydrogenase